MNHPQETMVRRLLDLLHGLPQVQVDTKTDLLIHDVAYDSRRVRPGDIFVAIPGLRDDGARYVGQALARGAVAVVAERSDIEIPPGVPLLVVPEARRALALLASSRWDQPARRLGLVGVTGTDGKTTTSMLTAEIFEAAGLQAGLLTTVELRIGGRHLPNRFHHTTPEAPELQRTLARMVETGAAWAVLEISSHALALERVTGCEFDVAVLTNVSPEHLDFHGTLEEYRAAKGRLFESLAGRTGKGVHRFGVVNADDPSADYFKALCPVDVLTYALHRPADVRARDILVKGDGTSFVVDAPIGSRRLHTRLVGRFNVHNWLAAIAVAVGQGLGWASIERAAEVAEAARGRLQRIDEGQPFTVLVDFAHTPQALVAALESCRALTEGRILVVFGHPGERYSENRARLGAVAVEGSDLAIVTTDDPYGEDPKRVIDQIVEGAQRAGGVEGKDYVVVPDRRRAIRQAIERAAAGDLVLIAGRGHLRQLVVGNRHVPFDDARVAREVLRRLYRRAA